jgi:hypothetical protein
MSVPLTARDTSQVLKDIALGVRPMRRLGDQARADSDCGPMTIESDGWMITFYIECNRLDYCHSCVSPDGQAYRFDSLQRYGTHPVELLSTWERSQLERLLLAL